ncbi:hypothetical protein HMPREF1982_03801 [Clostridiales bacterium oral taxon 876 str. F0540]|nr:hypothetical protein HMPREF1982_03801 [Clostridiales bacterium oral taxon 876 str. F0540]
MSNYKIANVSQADYKMWDEFVDKSPQGSIFSKTIWLNSVGCDYKILGCFDKSDKLIAGMPIVYDKNNIVMPKLTQTLGILLSDFSEMKYVKRISKEKDIIGEIVNNIPKVKGFNVSFHYNFTNWMPFMWKGYNEFTRYTYVIDDITDLTIVDANLLDKTKSVIKKARCNLCFSKNFSNKQLYDLVSNTFSRQNLRIPFSYEWFNNLDMTLSKSSASQKFFCIDRDNNLHSVLYLVFDSNTAYYLLGGYNPLYKNSGAMYLTIYEAIEFASRVSKKFDFEGSIIPNIEHVFRSFGAKQMRFFNITKDNSIASNIKNDLRKYGKLLLKAGY